MGETTPFYVISGKYFIICKSHKDRAKKVFMREGKFLCVPLLICA